MSAVAISGTVGNHSPAWEDRNLFDEDIALREAVTFGGGDWGTSRLREMGAVAGSVEAGDHARRAERNLPRLHSYDRYGHRVDDVELDPSWHWLLGAAVRRELHALPWREQRDGVFTVWAAMAYQWTQVNSGVMCPITMTFGAVPALRRAAPDLAAVWEPRLTRPDYPGTALAGQAYTETQGGSDIRANTTRAEPGGDGSYEICGHKWFCSAPMCDVFLCSAQTSEGLSAFLVERGPGMELRRLKDKLGTRSLPTGEVEFRGARGHLVGAPGEGMAAIIDNLSHVRLWPILASAAGMRAGLVQAVHHARHRLAFGSALIAQPAMRSVLCDLALESEAATATAMRVASMYAQYDSPLRRVATTLAKFWICKRAPAHIAESLECLGGNGYIEDSGLPRLLRDSPVQSIWEGPSNVIALDIVRLSKTRPDALTALFEECGLAAGADRRLDRHVARTKDAVAGLGADDQPAFGARRIAEALALALQASVLIRQAPAAVADGFCATRLGDTGQGRIYGTLPKGLDTDAILDRVVA